jgi:hypothetical protein
MLYKEILPEFYAHRVAIVAKQKQFVKDGIHPSMTRFFIPQEPPVLYPLLISGYDLRDGRSKQPGCTGTIVPEHGGIIAQYKQLIDEVSCAGSLGAHGFYLSPASHYPLEARETPSASSCNLQLT